jgi:hypothetical protein
MVPAYPLRLCPYRSMSVWLSQPMRARIRTHPLSPLWYTLADKAERAAPGSKRVRPRGSLKGPRGGADGNPLSIV